MQEAINKLRERRRDGEEGFTLIELMVVVLIIAILLAIAIPTFLGARQRAQDRAAQSTVRNSLTAAKTIYTDNQDYTGASVAALNTGEPSITHQLNDAASTGPKQVSVKTTSDTFYGVAKSAGGTCFAIRDIASAGGGTKYAKPATCTADAAAALAAGSWLDSW